MGTGFWLNVAVVPVGTPETESVTDGVPTLLVEPDRLTVVEAELPAVA